jgi:hypothetical protein
MPGLLTPLGLRELSLAFRADLSRGGYLKLAARPWRDRSPRDPASPYTGGSYSFGIADLEIDVDGQAAGRLTEYGERHTDALTHSHVRYIELPQRRGARHALTLRARSGTGVELQRLTLYATGRHMEFGRPSSHTDDFSSAPRWEIRRHRDSRLAMTHDPGEEVLRLVLWRERNASGTLYWKMPQRWSDPIAAQFDLRIDEAAAKSWGWVGLLRVDDTASSRTSLAVRLYAEDGQVVLGPSRIALDLDEWYRVALKRRHDQIAISVSGARGEILGTHERSVEHLPERGFDAFGVTNESGSSETRGPLRLSLDNLQINCGGQGV